MPPKKRRSEADFAPSRRSLRRSASGDNSAGNTSAASHIPDERGGNCYLLNLPSTVLLGLWPTERVVAGLRICHQLRRELSENTGKILLVKRDEGDVSEDSLTSDFRRVSHLKVSLKWRGLPGGLVKCVESLGTGLAILDFSNNDIGAEGVERLAGVLGQCKALTHLDLSDTRFGEEGARSLARVLGGCTKLAHLGLKGNMMGDKGAGSLAEVLGECKALTHLDLSFNIIDARGAGSLAVVLGQCKALVHLDLSGNPAMCNEGTTRLAGVLGACKALAYLDLSINNIGDEGAGSLAEVLGECTELAHLGLRLNEIGDAGAGSLAEVLGDCKALTHLDLKFNEIGPEGAGRLTEVLAEGRALALDLSFQRDPISAQFMPHP